MGSQHNSFELLSAVAAAAAVGTASVANFMAFTNTITLTRPAKIVDCVLASFSCALALAAPLLLQLPA